MALPTISIVVPCLNEELNLEGTIKNIQETVPEFFDDWEILLFNDGSTDATGKIAERLARGEPRIRVTPHATSKNLGACYKEAIGQATKEYFMLVPGDNECGVDLMRRVFAMAGSADIIVPFTSNPEVRPWARRVLSNAFTFLVRTISGQKLKYFNGAVLHQTRLLKDLSIRTNGFGYQAEILVRLLRKRHSWLELSTEIMYRPFGRSKALRLSSLTGIFTFLVQLAWMRLRPAKG